MSKYASSYGLENHGIRNVGIVYWNPSTPMLYEEIVRRREGFICHLGPIAIRTGDQTGRSDDDKFIVKEPTSSGEIAWDIGIQPFHPAKFDGIYNRLLGYVQGRDIFVQDCYAGSSLQHQVPIRIVTEDAWQNLFARNMFVQVSDPDKLVNHEPEFTIICVPRFHASPHLDGTNSEACVIVHFGKRLILIGGTSYAGEIKRSVFTAMTYMLPHARVLPLYCAANMGKDDDVALMFGRLGAGKTTLSTDSQRTLIGDDEHGWGDSGIFNFEGGSYANVMRISAEHQPEIYECTRKFGTILENVAFDSETRRLDLNDAVLAETTRAAYPNSHIQNAVRSGTGGHPKNIVMLMNDAFGVLPPIAKLTHDQAIYHFLSGYSTEIGDNTEPEATFSACFGAPLMALRPTVYAKMLGERIKRHDVNCWLVNTGWSGGKIGGGQRLGISITRTLINTAIEGKMDAADMEQEQFFGIQLPKACEGISSDILNPQSAWQDRTMYNETANMLVAKFNENFQKFENDVDDEVKQAGPRMIV